MITKWEIISRKDPKTHSLLYFLVMDGTEHDARLIAKKLAGYAQAPQPALAPFVYSFALPADLDEDRQEKIRTAVQEGVTHTNKINQFVPGGILGDPLFNEEVNQEDKAFPTFLTLDPSESLFRKPEDATKEDAPNHKPDAISLTMVEGLSVQSQTVMMPQNAFEPNPHAAENTAQEEQFPTSSENTEEWPKDAPKPSVKTSLTLDEEPGLSINDKDMLIKDMEGTLLDKMPLNNILSAETKYDMFVDLENTRQNEQAVQQREQKMNALADGKASLEETFNIFEQKIKDQTCMLDVDDLTKITERIPKKDFGFVKNSPSAQETIRLANATGIELSKIGDEPVGQKPIQQEGSPKQASNDDGLPEIPSLRPADPSRQTRDFADEVTDLNLPKADTMSAAAGQDKNTSLPEEVTLENTVVGAKKAGQEDDSLPTITVRGQHVKHLEKTFHLETTLNTELAQDLAKAAKQDISEEENNALPDITINGEKVKSLEKTFHLETTLNPELAQNLAKAVQQDISEGENNALPDITINGEKVKSLEKTFHLETTLNTELAKELAKADKPNISAEENNALPNITINDKKAESLDHTFHLETTLNTKLAKELEQSPKQDSADEENNALPDITINGQKVKSLEKTFHLETTLNTELAKELEEAINKEASAEENNALPDITINGKKLESLDHTFHLATTLNTKLSDELAKEFEKEASAEDKHSLPEITLGGQNTENLDKTFHLETTLTTDLAAHPTEEPQQDASADAEKTQKVFRQPGKKLPPVPSKADAALPQSEQQAEPVMEENREEKTTFRIRKINQQHPVPPTPPAGPEAPAAPHAPSAPAAPSAPQAPAAPHVPVAPQAPAAPEAPSAPAAPVAPAVGPATINPAIEKTKTIDRSIELPLSELKKHNWPLEVPLVPTYTIDNMVISVNRFAHATAISVIDSPGKLYNPLVLHGTTGTGKTHFLHAIGYALSKKYGQENIFITNGVRFSRGIQRYVMEGNIEKFEKFMDSVKAILIDDIHLIAINEQNRVHISKLLNKFLKEQKQIIITSKYPPESLAKLEELIQFKLDSGWISELKKPQGNTHLRIVKKMLLDNGINVTDAEISEFFGAPHMTLGTVQRSLRRVKVLEKLVFPAWEEKDRSQAKIFEKLLATAGEDETSQIYQQDIESAPTPTLNGGDWGRIGIFYPQNNSHMMNWMVYALEQRAKELGVKGGFEIAVRSSYATENVISSAFKIANLCDNKKLKGAVILGPSLQVCDPSVRENFYDILTHMLEVMLIRCGTINLEDVKSPSTYVKILSELLR